MKDCLEALRRQTYEDMEVILVDNASTDNSVELAQKLYPGIRVVELDDNTGFAYAVNRGIEAAEGEYVLLLNNDTIVFPNFVKNQYKMIKGKPDVFSCSALMIQNADHELVDDAGDELAALGWGFAPDRDKPVSGCMVPHEVFSSCAGAAIYRKSVFDEIGLFDESFLRTLRTWISATGQGLQATETCIIRMLRCITLAAPQAAQDTMPSRWSCRRETACICLERTCPHGRWCLMCHLSRQELS